MCKAVVARLSRGESTSYSRVRKRTSTAELCTQNVCCLLFTATKTDRGRGRRQEPRQALSLRLPPRKHRHLWKRGDRVSDPRPLNRLVVTPGLWPRAHALERPTGVHALQAQPLVPQEGWQWAAAVSRADLGFLFSGTAGWLGGLLQAGEHGVELGLCHPPAPREPAGRVASLLPPPGDSGLLSRLLGEPAEMLAGDSHLLGPWGYWAHRQAASLHTRKTRSVFFLLSW